ncbi:High-affnity carbon uptake protein Hat/HatR [Enhygromyxa salina]|uniref:High-affnity carbon uptake protein Hat/HatR n=1 Tax=Enhygromyxa salina TaxID=215803 RepID=A0A0C2DBA4_9BACT|nr:serine/threonine-protein kinase [Enhygromyxa salina]KIG18695.1 High-affnity carbon uptake protein Hat/HatR [Enhygromyxa salina]
MIASPSQELDTSHLETETLAGSHETPEGSDDTIPSIRLCGESAGSTVAAGSMIGRYRIRERLGAGGMGEVFSAHDLELDRVVALKLINQHGGASTRGTSGRECERLRLEAQSLARLSHPNVVHVYEVGSHEGRTFLAMELINGPTLADWEPDSLAEIVSVYAQAGSGLAAAHAAGLAHRDFKPSNVLIGAEGRVRVVDFGLAVPKQMIIEAAPTLGDESNEDGRAASASLAGPGTLPYMAPEQAFMGTGGALADQFSFCVSLFEALYGARPFPAKGVMELLYKLDTCTVEFPAEPPKFAVPRWLKRLLLRGLSRRPEQRFDTMDALVTELSRDRQRLWRRVGFAGAVAGITALTVLAGSAALQPDAPAQLPEPVLDGVWDAQRRAELSQAFASLAQPGDSELAQPAAPTWAAGSEATVVAELDDWSQHWLSEARDGERLQDPATRDAVRACLAGQREQVNFTINALLTGDSVLLEGAVAAVDALPEPSRCDAKHAAAFASADAELMLPALQELAQAAAQRGLGHVEQARVGADAVLRQAQAHGWASVELAALRQRGLAEIDAGRRAAGLADLQRARELAIRTGDHRTEAELWVELVWAGRNLDNLELRRDRLDTARAHVDALLSASDSSEANRRAQLLQATVRLSAALDHMDTGEAALAEPLLLEGLRQLDGVDAGDSILAIDHLHVLALARAQAGLFEQADYDYRRALARAERVRGQDHPSNARIWHDAGALAHERGELELARERLVRARNIRAAALRVDHPELARSELGLASLEFVAQRYEVAKDHAQQALRSLEQATGDRDALPETLRLLGQLEARESRWEAAVGYYERSLALMPTPGIQRSLVELELGKSLAALGQHQRALPLIDAALPPIAARLGPAHCHQMVRSYERHAESSLNLGLPAQAIASLESGLACAKDPSTRARLEAELQRLH